MIGLLAIPGFVIFIGLMVWIFKHSQQMKVPWQQAYLYRINELKSLLPPSDIFPAILVVDKNPGFGEPSYNSFPHILYIRDKNLVIETVEYAGSPENYQAQTLLDYPLEMFSVGVVKNSSSKIALCRYREGSGKSQVANMVTVPEQTFLSKDINANTAFLTDSNLVGMDQRKVLVEALVQSGIEYRDL